MAGSVSDELCAWAELCKKKSYLMIIPIPVFWVEWKERKTRAFDGVENDFSNIRDG